MQSFSQQPSTHWNMYHNRTCRSCRKGYIIPYIYEEWHFKEKSNELFQTYIKTFLKMKQEVWDGLLSAIVKKRRETTYKTKCNMKASSSIMTRHRRTQDYAL